MFNFNFEARPAPAKTPLTVEPGGVRSNPVNLGKALGHHHQGVKPRQDIKSLMTPAVSGYSNSVVSGLTMGNLEFDTKRGRKPDSGS